MPVVRAAIENRIRQPETVPAPLGLDAKGPPQ